MRNQSPGSTWDCVLRGPNPAFSSLQEKMTDDNASNSWVCVFPSYCPVLILLDEIIKCMTSL